MPRRRAYLAIAILTAGCVAHSNSTGRPRVVTAFYPLAYTVREIGGRLFDVGDITPAGTEPHDLELTPSQAIDVADARLAIVMGHGFQPAVERSASERDGRSVVLLDRLGGAVRRSDDPHVWLDPNRMIAIAKAIDAELEAIDPRHRQALHANTSRLIERLTGLDREFARGLAQCRRRVILTAHDAFAWLAQRYHLRQAAVTGFSPDAEPTPDRIAQLAAAARRDRVTTVFTESLVSPRVAETLAREAGGLRTAVLNPIEGLTDRQVASGDNYFSLQRANLRALRTALDCS
jgi:zinc transport system substrate-binding protein